MENNNVIMADKNSVSQLKNSCGKLDINSVRDTENSQQSQKKTIPELKTDYYDFKKFSIIEKVPASHKYLSTSFAPTNQKEFSSAYQAELVWLFESLPDGIFVKGYEDRRDLFSALILGPEATPYEGGLFAFEIKLPNDYPRSPPLLHFISFSRKHLSANICAQKGTVCFYLSENWKAYSGFSSWSITQSSILQALVSIRNFDLVPEPYYHENRVSNSSRWVGGKKKYNQTVVRHLINAMAAQLKNPPMPWQLEVNFILGAEIPKMLFRLECWRNVPALLKENDDEKKGTGDESRQGEEEDYEIMKVRGFSLLRFEEKDKVFKSISNLKDRHAKFCVS